MGSETDFFSLVFRVSMVSLFLLVPPSSTSAHRTIPSDTPRSFSSTSVVYEFHGFFRGEDRHLSLYVGEKDGRNLKRA